MANQHSRYAVVSFITLLATVLFLTSGLTASQLTKYSFFEHNSILTTVKQALAVGVIVCCLTSIVTALIALFRKGNSPILPTISLTVVSFAAFVLLWELATEQILVSHAEKGVISNYGLFRIPTTTVHDSQAVSLYEQRFLVANTDTIPAVIGTRFGFNYVITGEPRDGNVSIVKITKYPDPGMRRNDGLVHADTTRFSVSLNTLRYTGYRFDHDYELIPGKWQFEIWHDRKMLLSQAFVAVTTL